MAGILRDLGMTDYDPGVLTQMLEFSYRYISNVLEDAKLYSNHARKRSIDSEDIKLAVQVLTEQSVTSPPTRDVLLDLAQSRNNTQLPLVKPGVGLRLPPDRYCLTNTNYRLRANRGGGTTGAGQSGSSSGNNGNNGRMNMTNGVNTFNLQVQQPSGGNSSGGGGSGSGGGKRKWEEVTGGQ